MILIRHPDLDVIKNKYTNIIVDKVLDRIDSIFELIRLLESTTEIKIEFIEGNHNKLSGGIAALLNDRKYSAKKTIDLLTNLEDCRKSISNFKNRIEGVQKTVTLFDKKTIHDLVSSPPEKLKNLQDVILKTTTCTLSDILFEYLFSYKGFYEDIKAIGESLNLKVCPYCNRIYITTVVIDEDDKIIGPTYDHFFPKATNPLLSVSFYNLIPSCYLCNSTLKHEKEFSLDTHLHPYKHEMGSDAVFDFVLDATTTPIRNKIDFKPFLNVKVAKDSPEYKRLEKTVEDDWGSINVFKLNELYATHNDVVEEIHDKFDENSQCYSDSIKKLLDNLASSKSEFYRFHFSNYYDDSDFNKRPLAKLTRDIFDKMKYIYDQTKFYKTQ
ncbi:MAG: hypothetical protein JSS93_12920 [Bacteroidetes bacterium]|nr:hypothetical protein [Bacteroidota bacterium]